MGYYFWWVKKGIQKLTLAFWLKVQIIDLLIRFDIDPIQFLIALQTHRGVSNCWIIFSSLYDSTTIIMSKHISASSCGPSSIQDKFSSHHYHITFAFNGSTHFLLSLLQIRIPIHMLVIYIKYCRCIRIFLHLAGTGCCSLVR